MRKGKDAVYVLIIPLLLLAAILISMLVNHSFSNQQAYQRAQSVLTDSAREQVATFYAKIDGQFAILEAFAAYFGDGEDLDVQQAGALMGSVAEAGSFGYVGLVDPQDGRAWVNGGTSFSAADREYYAVSLSGERYIGLVEESRVGGQPMFILSVPVLHNNEVIAVAMGAYDGEGFVQLLTSEAYGGQGYSYVLDSAGNLIIDSEIGSGDRLPEEAPNMISFFEGTILPGGETLDGLKADLAAGGEGGLFYQVDGDSRYAVYQPLGLRDWFIFNVVSRQKIQEEVQQSTRSSLVMLGVVVGSLLLILLFIVFRERQNRRRQEADAAKLRYLAERDSLTGLYNRTTFIEKVRELLSQGAPGAYAIIAFDVDRFKLINELFGQERGDRLLCYIAERLKAFADGRGICCRITADHFAICLPDDREWLREIFNIVRKEVELYDIPFELSVSVGLCVAEDPRTEVNTLLDRAALAQKSVKREYGVQCAVYEDTMWGKLLEEQEIAGSAGAALEQGQFVVYLQPQYDHACGRLVGAEALVRWNHPEKGLLAPAAFLPVLERNGFISKLDEYVWEQVCQLLRRRQEQGKPRLPIAVNVSRTDIYNPELYDVITGMVERYGIAAPLLKLEITESAYVENREQLIAVLKQLREAGFQIEMDDFGSGYSSLNALKDMPVDIIKLDMRFLSQGSHESGQRQTTILKSVVSMALELGLEIIAEGVETKEQADQLLEFGCPVVQGYYYARPMPAEEFEKLES